MSGCHRGALLWAWWNWGDVRWLLLPAGAWDRWMDPVSPPPAATGVWGPPARCQQQKLRNPQPLRWGLGACTGILQSCSQDSKRWLQPPGPCSPALPAARLTRHQQYRGCAQCCRRVRSRAWGRVNTLFRPRKALVSGVSLPLTAADMAGPCHECSPSSSTAPTQALVQTLPHLTLHCACPGASWDPACLQVGGRRLRCCSCSLCWLLPLLLLLAPVLGQVQPWHQISPLPRLGRRVLQHPLQPWDLEAFVSGNRRTAAWASLLQQAWACLELRALSRAAKRPQEWRWGTQKVLGFIDNTRPPVL